MKNIFAKATLLVSGLLVSVVARADCTSDPFRMGSDAAGQACEDIAQGWYPGAAYSAPLFGTTPETTCTWQDVVQCKNAMAQYLRENPSCGDLIAQDVSLSDPDGTPRGSASSVWRAYVTGTCNLR